MALLGIQRELLQRPMSHAFLVQGGAGLSGSKALNRNPAVPQPGPFVFGVLIVAPADTRLFKHFGNRRPAKRRTLVGVPRTRQRPLDQTPLIVGLGVRVGTILAAPCS